MPYIINYLSSGEEISEIYLVPGAFITERKGNKLIKVSDNPLTAEDIRDTLVALRSHTPFALGPIGREGMFSFGVKNIGRFRISYLTQRGSYVVHILKTPYQIPPINKLCPDKSILSKMEESLRLYNSGILVFQGKNQAIISALVYSLLQNLCQNYNKVVFVIESPLSFLLGHGRSLVIQREVGVDVESFEEGLKDALHMHPDIIYIGQREVISPKEQEQILRIIESESLLILNLPFVDRILLQNFSAYLKAWIEVNAGEDGALHCHFKHIQPQA
ncbi:MAG: twitching motility protein [Aquificaceae bacterium]|nr:twitching motility protein [Aquificaceae bacterium]